MSAMAAWWSLVRWDWAREMQRKNTLITMAMLALITLFLFSFAIPPNAEVLQHTRAGILWVTFLLAGTVGVDRAFRGDGDGRLLEGLLLAPIGRATLYHARVASTFLFIVTLEAITTVLFLVLFNQSLGGTGLLALVVTGLAATLGFSAVGVLLSAMTWSLRTGDVLLRILLFPLLIPLLGAAVGITSRAFHGQAPSVEQVGVIVAFDLVFLGAGHLLFEHIVQDFGPQG